MALFLQADAISAGRAEIDDSVDGKVIQDFSPLVGIQDGVNKNFSIPQQRVVIANIQLVKNGKVLVSPTDYTVLNAKLGQLQFVAAPVVPDEIKTTFSYTWVDDIEMDHHLNRAANELGYDTYHTDSNTVAGSESVTPISDFPNGLKAALIYLGASKVASALSARFGLKYDISAGDLSYSTSAMAEAYEKLAERLVKQGLTARDDHYKGTGRQYRPSTATQGFVLPYWTPKR